MKNNYDLFLEQCIAVIDIYPNLKLIEEEGKFKYLKGILDITNDIGNNVGHYLIEIHFSSGFPYRFPNLYEVGGAIPNDINWHKYNDGRCCLTVLPDEIIKCKAGIRIQDFIRKYCSSFFANHIHRLRTGFYLNGEYSHGYEGLKEFYINLLKTNDIRQWRQYFLHAFYSKKYDVKRNDLCFCNSNVKFKLCHLKIFDSMRDIGFDQCLSDLSKLGTNINND